VVLDDEPRHVPEGARVSPRLHRARVTVLRAVVAGALTLACAGCGVGAGKAPGGVHLTVTDRFGTRPVVSTASPSVSGDETVMRLLQRNAKVRTRYGGAFVQSIDGLAGGRSGGRPIDWFYFVNGIEAPAGASKTHLDQGDRVWWDRRDWGVTLHIPAVIGSYPEPFVHGVGGKRLPVRVECGVPGSGACDAVTKALLKEGVPAANATVATSPGKESLRVIVGPWSTLRIDSGVAQLRRGPQSTGVFARVADDGRSIVTLDQRGRVVRTLGPGTGLIAATELADAGPFWVVTGTDDAGVAAAARAFADGESTMQDKFALAISNDRAIALPEVRP
jgi:hypothetical protein